MVVVAHPDDESCGGGTLGRFIQNGTWIVPGCSGLPGDNHVVLLQGISLHFVWMTKGECGTSNQSLTPVDVAYIRHLEAINAANVRSFAWSVRGVTLLISLFFRCSRKRSLDPK